MLFQALDDKKECIGVYAQGELHFEKIPTTLTHTWDYSSSVELPGLQFAKFYAEGKTLSEVCPEHLRDEFKRCSKRMKSFYKSFLLSKVSLDEHCFFDLVPSRHLLEYFSIKNEICAWVFENYQKPDNHDFLAKVSEMTTAIATQTFSVDKSELNRYMAEDRVKTLRNKLVGDSHRVHYNPFGTVTGRLTVSRNSFPILTLDKKFRKIVKPKNDWLVELDFNAAELRTLLGLSGSEQPEEDLHQWNLDNLYKEEELSRDQAKEKIFSLY